MMKKVIDLPKPEVVARYATPLPSFITDEWVRQQAAPNSRKWQKHIARHLATHYEHWDGQEIDAEFVGKITRSLAIVGFAKHLRRAAKDDKGEAPKKALHNPFSFLEIRLLQMRKSTGIKEISALLTKLADDRERQQDFRDAAFYFCVTAPNSVFDAAAVAQQAHQLGEEELAQFITDYNHKEKESGQDRARLEEKGAVTFWQKALSEMATQTQQVSTKPPDLVLAQHFIDITKALSNAAAHFAHLQSGKHNLVARLQQVKDTLAEVGEETKSVRDAITALLAQEIPESFVDRDDLLSQVEQYAVLSQKQKALKDDMKNKKVSSSELRANIDNIQQEMQSLSREMVTKFSSAAKHDTPSATTETDTQNLPDLNDQTPAACWQQTLESITKMAEQAQQNPPNAETAKTLVTHANFLRTIVDHAKHVEKERVAQQVTACLQEAKQITVDVGEEAGALSEAIDKFSAAPSKDFASEEFLQEMKALAKLHEERKNTMVQIITAEESQNSEQSSPLAELALKQKEQIKELADQIIDTFLFPHQAHAQKLLSREELRQLAATSTDKPPPIPIPDPTPTPEPPPPTREETPEEKEFKRVESLLAALLSKQEFAVAQRVSACAQVLFPQASFTFPPEAILLLSSPLSFCAGAKRFDNGDLQAGEQAMEQLATAMKDHVYAAPAARLLSFAAALVPAVLLLNYHVRKLFDADSSLLLEEQKEHLEPLRAAIYDLGEAPMTLSELGVDGETNPESGLQELQAWHEARQQKKFKFALATHVWHHWMNADSAHGELGKIVAELSQPTTVQQGVARAQKFIATYKNNETAVDGFADTTNQHIHSYASSKIVGGVRLALRTEVAHAIELIEGALVGMVDDGHLSEREWQQQRRHLVEVLAAAKTQMLTVADDEPLPMQAARQSFAAMADLLLTGRAEAKSLGEEKMVAKAATLARASLGCFAALPTPTDSRDDFFIFVDQAERQLAAPALTWTENFAQRLQEKDCTAAGLLLAMAPWSSEPMPQQKMQQNLQARVAECRRELEEWQGELLWRLARTPLAASVKDKLKEEINRVVTQGEEDFDVARQRRILARVQHELCHADEKTKNSLQHALSKFGDSPHAKTIAQWLSQDDFALAERGLVALQNNWPFPLSPMPSPHLENFMKGDYVAGGKSLAAAPAEGGVAIKKGKALHGFAFTALSESTRHKRARWIDFWREIFSSDANKVTNALYGWLEQIGGLDDICVERKRGMAQITFRPLSGLEDKNCGLGHFGSQAAGRWRIVLASATKTKAKQLVALTEDVPPQEAVFIFCNSALSHQTRTEFMHMNEQNNRHAALVDWVTLFYLCTQAENENIPRAFFELSLPWAGVNPFVVGRTVLPGEVFCGLTKELHTATATTDSGIQVVYGGRGLGKTTFLQQAQRLAMSDGTRAFMLELKGRTKELQQTPAMVWEIIRERIGHALGLGNGKTWLSDWLEAKSSQRLLLLIDDADDFVRADVEQGGEQIAAFNALAANFSGRVKVIFAGSFALHDVAQKNDKLSTGGAPQQVAPPPDRDLGEMTRVLAESFMAAGFVFAHPDLLLSLAHRLNGNPALMQIFCHHWLAQMRNKTTVPRQITATDVADAWSDRTLVEPLRAALHDTLQGNSRHALAAYTAANSAEDGGNLTAQKLYDECRGWHPPAMEGVTKDGFKEVLGELAAMNILRQNNDKTWRLRSVAMLSLLGGAMGVEDKLARLTEQDLAEEVSADLLRRKLSNGLCSPLTTEQEVKLLGGEESWRANVIFGTIAAGRDLMASALRALCQHHDWSFKNCTAEDKDDFGTQLRVFWRQLQTEEQSGIFMVSDIAPWDREWLDVVAARNVLSAHKLRVVFVGGGKKAWGWEVQNYQPPMYLEPVSERALHSFLSNHLASSEVIARLMKETGGFVALINACLDAESMDEETLYEKLDGWRTKHQNMAARDLPPALNPLTPAVTGLLANGHEWSSSDMQKTLDDNSTSVSAEGVWSWLESLSLAHKADNKRYLNPECAYLFTTRR